MRQLVDQVCYSRYHVSFYLWLIGSVLQHCKVPKYYDQDCRYQTSTWTDNFEFLDQICPKRIFLVKNTKGQHRHWIVHTRISLGTKFQLKLIILNFWTQKTVFLVENEKFEHHRSILHIQISKGTKFQLKLTILVF